MPLTSSDLGNTSATVTQTIDARWLMAYAVGINDLSDCYYATHLQQISAHPLFPVAVEWAPVVQSYRNLLTDMTAQERGRGVHGAHDLHIHRAIRPLDVLTTEIQQIGVTSRGRHAVQVARIDTRDPSGVLVCKTYMHSLYRNVELIGGEQWIETPPPPPPFSNAQLLDIRWPIQVLAQQAHVYTECARIYSPIHTDRATALAAGLPDLILHGTCTLAMAVSGVVQLLLNGDPSSVTRIGCRFSAMVRMPSTITLHLMCKSANAVAFEVLTEDGDKALSDAYLCWQDDDRINVGA